MEEKHMNRQLRVDPEFRDKIPPLTEDEFKQLEQNILADGEIYEPIIVWNGTIVDGHNRYKIAQKHPEIPFKTREMNFPDKWAAFDWMYAKQLGRRNLSDENRTYIIGKMYEARKKTQGNHAERGKDGRYLNSQNANIGESKRTPRTDEILAAEIGVNHSTVIRSEKFSKGIDAIREMSPDAADKILRGGTGVKKGDVQQFTTMSDEEQKEFVSTVSSGTVKEQKKKSSGGNKQNRAIAKAVEAAVDGLLNGTDATITIDDVVESVESSLASCARSIQQIISAHGYDPNGEYKELFESAVERGIEKVKEIFN